MESSCSYDSNSNRISGTQNAELFTAVYDSQDRMLSYSQGEAPEKLFQYNLNGELTQIAQGSEYTSFTPDALGRIKAVTLPDYSMLSYSLDHSGRRVQKLKNGSKVYRNIYEDEFKIAAEVGPLGQFKEYVYATNINSADYMKVGTTFYRIIKDHLGSPRFVVNARAGFIVQRMDYNCFAYQGRSGPARSQISRV